MAQLTGEYLFKNHEIIQTSGFQEEIPEDQSIYEVLRVIQGTPLFLTEHLNRLYVSLKILNLRDSYDLSPLRSLEDSILTLISKNAIENCNLKIIVTHFNGQRSLNCYGFFIPSSYPPADAYKTGVNTILYHGTRENPNAKVYQKELREDVAKKLKAADAYEALLVNEAGEISEGSRSNLFFVKNQTVYTPPAKQVLLGITREKILQLMEDHNIPYEVTTIHEKDLEGMNGAFMTGTSPKVLPLRRIGSLHYASASHPVIQKIMELYNALIEAEIRNNVAPKIL
ncbi:aminotransferase class IV [Isachenkonia alkalipeptolytica]|uniref:Aminotransferase IV n=1 Tax=Isachenkonia alkalipeptolytica TaxID=2565777 RepID=A0AA43XMF6_9CLOT|nr:aminotransferase class IV [Isachenkonia alkalipeptolytica]NBG89402.1 aminotransferase IV [Isachenkonia alkalipeptolytica]